MAAINGLKQETKDTLQKLKGPNTWDSFLQKLAQNALLTGIELTPKTKNILSQAKANNIDIKQAIETGVSYAVNVQLTHLQKEIDGTSGEAKIEAFIKSILESEKGNDLIKLTQSKVYELMSKRTGKGANRTSIGKVYRRLKPEIDQHNKWIKENLTQE